MTDTVDQSGAPPARAWQHALLPPGATLQDAIRNLNQTALRIALVVSQDGRLIGTVTDGDVRRGLLRGVALADEVLSVAKRDPLVVPPDVTREMVLKLMQVNLFDAIPVIDADRRVTGLHLLNDLLTVQPRSNLMVIMAGGRGSRLGTHTDNCPKPLLPIGGKPILEHIIERARDDGFRRFVLAVHYLGPMIEAYCGDGSRWQVSIDYLRESNPLGTAGALGLLKPTPEAPIVVSNGDVITDISYAELLDFHCRQGATATMAVRLHEWQHPFGVVHTNGVDIVGFEEKPVARTHINAGIYVLDPAALEFCTADEPLDMPMLFGVLQRQSRRTIVYPMHEPWLDIGRVDDLKRADRAQTRGNVT